MNWMNTIYQSALFRGFSYEEFERLFPHLHGRTTDVKKETLLIREGELSSFCGIVVSGSLAAIKVYYDGTINILDIMFPSDVYGLDMALTRSKICAIDIQSLEDSVVYMFPFLGAKTFSWMNAAQRDQMTENILTYIANETIRKLHKIEITAHHSLRKRILTYLNYMSAKRQSPTFTIPFSREQLAWFLCVNRSTLSHELAGMRSEGLIDFKKNRFSLLKKDNG